jgi:hypothetical protein
VRKTAFSSSRLYWDMVENINNLFFVKKKSEKKRFRKIPPNKKPKKPKK